MYKAYDKIPLHDEYDVAEKWIRKKSNDSIDINGNNIYQAGLVRDGTYDDLPETKIQLYSTISCDDTAKYPKEKRKSFIAFLVLILSFIINCISIVLTHQRVPDQKVYPPLPDISLDNIAKKRWLNDVADILVVVCTVASASIVVLHRHRWILCRRVFLILAMLYFMRSITMYVTVLPLANDHVYCSPKMNQSLSFGQTVLTITGEVVKLLDSGGLPITGKKTLCGDYIFSGHTIILVITYLLIREYVPKRYTILQWSAWITAWFGMICLVVSHGHYTIDVLLGYFATTRTFWIYHTLSNNLELKRKSSTNPLSDAWWFYIFQYFEANVSGKLPKKYSLLRIGRCSPVKLSVG